VPGNDLFKRPWIPLFLCCLFWGGSLPASGDTGRQIEAPVRQSITTLKQTQQQEEQWRQEKEKLAARFEQLQQQQAEMRNRVVQLRQQIEATQKRLAAKEKQLADIEQIAGQINPFLEELVTTLKEHIADDLPFLTAERRQRVERLEGLMADPDVAVSEKYRKVMEAMQVEAEYGFTIETYQETITLDGQTLLADIFRLGRLGLFCLSLDGRQGGFYNPAEGVWQPLSASHRQALNTAIAIAAKRQSVELLTLPLGRLVIR
jgi:small-conductance mechanosensitive channel